MGPRSLGMGCDSKQDCLLSEGPTRAVQVHPHGQSPSKPAWPSTSVEGTAQAGGQVCGDGAMPGAQRPLHQDLGACRTTAGLWEDEQMEDVSAIVPTIHRLTGSSKTWQVAIKVS